MRLVFLLDVFCLGVKDAGFHQFGSISDYQEDLVDRFFPDGNAVRMTPEAARKLTEDAISYASGLGFAPSTDYKKASRVFGGITAADCEEQFVFGKDDKPFYIQGPSESPGCVERILRVLEARCGADGFHYTIAGDNFEPFDGTEQTSKAPSLRLQKSEAIRELSPGSQPGRYFPRLLHTCYNVRHADDGAGYCHFARARDRVATSGLRSLSLFGSVARGEAETGSDIDLAAEFEPTARMDLLQLTALERRLAELLGSPVDLLPEPVEKRRLQDQINRVRQRAF